MKPKQKDMVQPRLVQSPAAAAAAASVTAAYAIAAASDKKTVQASATENPETKNVQSETSFVKETASRTDILREENTSLVSKLAEITAENSKLMDKLDYAKSSHSELTKVSFPSFLNTLVVFLSWFVHSTIVIFNTFLSFLTFNRSFSRYKVNWKLKLQDALNSRFCDCDLIFVHFIRVSKFLGQRSYEQRLSSLHGCKGNQT